jgi:hypothetical protein
MKSLANLVTVLTRVRNEHLEPACYREPKLMRLERHCDCGDLKEAEGATLVGPANRNVSRHKIRQRSEMLAGFREEWPE